MAKLHLLARNKVGRSATNHKWIKWTFNLNNFLTQEAHSNEEQNKMSAGSKELKVSHPLADTRLPCQHCIATLRSHTEEKDSFCWTISNMPWSFSPPPFLSFVYFGIPSFLQQLYKEKTQRQIRLLINFSYIVRLKQGLNYILTVKRLDPHFSDLISRPGEARGCSTNTLVIN